MRTGRAGYSCDNAGVAARAASAHIILKRIKTPLRASTFILARCAALPAADCYHDLQPVSVCDRACTELAARHDLTVAFDCEAFPREPELIDKLAHAQRLFELPWLSVDRDRNHCL